MLSSVRLGIPYRFLWTGASALGIGGRTTLKGGILYREPDAAAQHEKR